jgi:hypothetical protein
LVRQVIKPMTGKLTVRVLDLIDQIRGSTPILRCGVYFVTGSWRMVFKICLPSKTCWPIYAGWSKCPPKRRILHVQEASIRKSIRPVFCSGPFYFGFSNRPQIKHFEHSGLSRCWLQYCVFEGHWPTGVLFDLWRSLTAVIRQYRLRWWNKARSNYVAKPATTRFKSGSWWSNRVPKMSVVIEFLPICFGAVYRKGAGVASIAAIATACASE